MEYEVIKCHTTEELWKLCGNSACTMLGYMPEELHLYIEQLHENGFIGDKIKVYTYDGLLLNKFLNNPHKFDNNLNIFSIDLDDMKDIEKFAVTLRFKMGYRWLDDIHDNNCKPFDM